ncbi:SagB/ThcOx family dehydrogenase [Pseudomonas sp. ICBG1301]|uniref:SagB/ThcOx family dehydrogenase n=1 Tax=Pseudomonas sp. ICBG1301 TaxID=2795987 RepID=UPI0019630677|nr:SagB/ThcOx family dehydrogenase [Pseudomonas sp. ICBG1301]MBM9484928.1 SagB/ThcOx family dehydrogenase [Pseudomonas sp. ICBG1301]
MKNIPHDYYLRFLDASVYEAVLDFHSKSNFTFHAAFQHCTGLHSLDEKHLAQLTGNELVLYPDMDLTVEFKISDEDRAKCLYRNESCESFSSEPLSFEEVEKLVSPLVSRSVGTHKRGYPSGGALYPVEVFVCSLTELDNDWPVAGRTLHLLPNSRRFEVMQATVKLEDIKAALLTSARDIGSPSVALIYAVYIPKNLFKYRYRGYRMALMEVGSIYMLVEIQAKKLGLACRPWSAYTDSMICKVLGVNPALFFPVCVHLIGRQHETC